MRGALLYLVRPEIHGIDCKQCHVTMINLDTGKPEMRRGRPAPRPAGVSPPCRRCPKQSPDAFSTLLPQNAEALEHYLQCEAVGSFPDDEIVKRNASILKQVREEVERIRRRDEMALVAVRQMLGSLGQINSAIGHQRR